VPVGITPIPVCRNMHGNVIRVPQECILAMGVDVPILPCTFLVLVKARAVNSASAQ
jgi:hypothetical protein